MKLKNVYGKLKYIAIHNVGINYKKQVWGLESNNLNEFRKELKELWNSRHDSNIFVRGRCDNCEWSILNTHTGEVLDI